LAGSEQFSTGANRSSILAVGCHVKRPEGPMGANYTAIVQQHGDWWIGWVAEVPGVNSQGHTREELLDNLRDALEEALAMNRADARAAAAGSFDEVSLSP
jgi:predicted RNase H-like HicB family nuclease